MLPASVVSASLMHRSVEEEDDERIRTFSTFGDMQRTSISQPINDGSDLLGDFMRERAVTTALATGRLRGMDAEKTGTRTISMTWREQPWFIEESTIAKDAFEEWLVGETGGDLRRLQKALSKLCSCCITDSSFANLSTRYRVMAFVALAGMAYGVRLCPHATPRPCTPSPGSACHSSVRVASVRPRRC